MNWDKAAVLGGSIRSWRGTIERNKYFEVTKRIAGLNEYQVSDVDWKNFENLEDYVLSYELSGNGYLCGCVLASKMAVYAPGTSTMYVYNGSFASKMKIVLDNEFELVLNGDLKKTGHGFVNGRADATLSISKSITLDMERPTIENVEKISTGLCYCENTGSGVINGAIPFGESLKIYTGLYLKGGSFSTSGNPAPAVTASNEVDITLFYPEISC